MDNNSHEQNENKSSRRSFLDVLLGIFGGVLGLGMAVPAAVYLWPARQSGPAENLIEVGGVDSIEEGGSKMFQAKGIPVIVIRVSGEQFKAFSAICTHLGCVVQWDPSKHQIACPCHAGFFNTDGEVISGPPPKPLTEYRTMVIDGQVRVQIA